MNIIINPCDVHTSFINLSSKNYISGVNMTPTTKFL